MGLLLIALIVLAVVILVGVGMYLIERWASVDGPELRSAPMPGTGHAEPEPESAPAGGRATEDP